MGFLRIADLDQTKRISHDSGDWIDVRANLSKRNLNNILTSLSTDILAEKVNFAATIGASQTLFEALVVGWSLDVPADIENYLSLEGEAAAWIDTVILEHFNEVQMGQVERGNLSNSAKGSRKASG